MTGSSTPLADALAGVDKAVTDGFAGDGAMRPHLRRALWELSEAVRTHLTGPDACREGLGPVLQASGLETAGGITCPVSTPEDYARYAAEVMNGATADDTEFIAEGPDVVAYVHQLAHVSATFRPDEGRAYPGDAGPDPFEVTPDDWRA